VVSIKFIYFLYNYKWISNSAEISLEIYVLLVSFGFVTGLILWGPSIKGHLQGNWSRICGTLEPLPVWPIVLLLH